MNALTLLKRDHDTVKELLGQLEDTEGPKRRAELLAKIKRELTIHEAIEENVFYPALRQEDPDLILEAFEEHALVDAIIAELEDLPTDDESWGAKATVMQENVEHHIKEEEGEMFKLARSTLEEGRLEELGVAMEERKAQETADLDQPAR
jgi:hemerythrin superfamily protein